MYNLYARSLIKMRKSERERQERKKYQRLSRVRTVMSAEANIRRRMRRFDKEVILVSIIAYMYL